jgi:trehalose-6-phosphate synthase
MNSTFAKTIAVVGAASLAMTVWKRRPVMNAAVVPLAPLPSNRDQLHSVVRESNVQPGLVVVANREPYIHEHGTGHDIIVKTSAGGLVTAIEPLLRTFHGTWVALGSGNADRRVVDQNDSVPVPPHAPEYTLKRVFLEAEEEQRYYAGFSNEALWPLCHNAFVKPIFREEDFRAYQRVNRRFAAAALAASRGVIVLQDYHFALAARFIKECDPLQTVGSFWHIPWPPAEIFAICPWKLEILDGLLALDLLGFHTAAYAQNFLETAARFVDCSVDRVAMTVDYRGKRTHVRAVPISIEYPLPHEKVDRDGERRRLGIGNDVHVSIAVDRVDYTKGILERYRAVEKLLETHPELIGRFTLLQIAAPSRREVPAYETLEQQIRAEASRLNERFGASHWLPIKLLLESVPRAEVSRYYHLADSAVVTPLHDGMNLVAKEYAASCSGDRGVLILSEFAGAAQELHAALAVNPFDVEAVAAAIHRAVTMSSGERRWRVSSLHRVLATNTIHDWTGKFFAYLATAADSQKKGDFAIAEYVDTARPRAKYVFASAGL